MANLPSLESLISTLESQQASGIQSPLKSQLYRTLTRIQAELSNAYETDLGVITPELQGATYEQMLSEVGSDFINLSSSLKKMRSSFLPIEIINEITRADGATVSITEILDADADKESFENVFFRMLGMPTSDELEDEVIKGVSKTGEIINFDKATIEKRLNERQIPINTRSGYPKLDSFIFENQSPFEYFQKIYSESEGTEIQDLQDISEKLREYNNLFNSLQKQEDRVNTIRSEILTILQKYDQQKVEDGTDQPENITQGLIDRINETFDQLLSLYKNESQETNSEIISDSIYFIFENSLQIISAPNDLPNIYQELYYELVLQKTTNFSVDNLSDPINFWRYSYLLFPPVQDGRISKCINDTTKLVAPPFLPESQRVINRSTMRPSLLEAIIRIRLDLSAGTTRGSPGAEKFSLARIGNDLSIKYRDIRDSYGLIEAIFIGRLFAALIGMSLNILKNVEVTKTNQSESPRKPQADVSPTNDHGQPSTESSGLESDEDKRLKAQATFEESVLLLLGQNTSSDGLSFQEGAGLLRTSNVKDSHLMSSMIELVSIPLQWINKKSSKKQYDVDKKESGPTAAAISGISTALGLSKGVGALDALVFIIALFSADETTLLSLLNENQFNNLKKQFPVNYFKDIDGKDIKRKTKIKAVEEISLIAIDTYNLFITIMRDPKALNFAQDDNLPADTVLEEPEVETTTV